MTTEHSNVGTARRDARRRPANYLEIVTAAEEYRKQAVSAQTKMARGNKTFEEGQADFAAALFALSEAGWSGGQLGREFGISATHARNIVKWERLRRDAERGHAPAADSAE